VWHPNPGVAAMVARKQELFGRQQQQHHQQQQQQQYRAASAGEPAGSASSGSTATAVGTRAPGSAPNHCSRGPSSLMASSSSSTLSSSRPAAAAAADRRAPARVVDLHWGVEIGKTYHMRILAHLSRPAHGVLDGDDDDNDDDDDDAAGGGAGAYDDDDDSGGCDSNDDSAGARRRGVRVRWARQVRFPPIAVRGTMALPRQATPHALPCAMLLGVPLSCTQRSAGHVLVVM
jgi:hypothetical protein